MKAYPERGCSLGDRLILLCTSLCRNLLFSQTTLEEMVPGDTGTRPHTQDSGLRPGFAGPRWDALPVPKENISKPTTQAWTILPGREQDNRRVTDAKPDAYQKTLNADDEHPELRWSSSLGVPTSPCPARYSCPQPQHPSSTGSSQSKLARGLSN